MIADYFRNHLTHDTLNLVNVRDQSAEQRFGTVLKTVRAGRLSQREIAERMVALGHRTWRQSTVTKTEAAERPLGLSEFLSLCSILEVDPQAVLSGVSRDEEQRYVELTIAVEHAKRDAERLAREGEAALAVLRDATGALDEFMAEHGLEVFYGQPSHDDEPDPS